MPTLPVAPLAAEPPKPALTAEQQEKLKERNRFSAEANRLQREGKLDEAIVAAEKAVAIDRQVFGEVQEVGMGWLEWLAERHQQRNDWAAARKARQEVLSLRIKRHGEMHWTVTDARLALADVESLDRMTPPQRQQLAKANRLNDEVVALYRQGRFREAVDPARQVLEIRKAVLGEKHPRYALGLNNLANLYREMGDYAKDEPLFRQALAIRKAVLGEQHPDYAHSLHDLAERYRWMGDYAKAEPLYRQALAIRKQTLGEQHPDYAASLNNLAVVYRDMGDYVRAEELLRRSLIITQKKSEPDHKEVAIHLQNLASLHLTDRCIKMVKFFNL